ncbi:MAG TPA: carboxypeptidase-like regulatory domain-containing protein [Pseudacidobacterium sp.]|jgi:hypothetical protein|nr:carboxypeptidase-like regulatory domain-containing protein [Pseudacidobacterium sp.]
MKQFCRTHFEKAGTVLALALCFLLAYGALAQDTRSVEGKVYAQGSPVAGAVVYLQDSKTNNVKSFISTQDGSYRFGQLSTDVDYQIWAEYKGSKSEKKNISSFNSKKQLVIDLHIKG